MPATRVLPAGRRSRVLWLFSNSFPETVRFRAAATSGAAPSGRVEVERRRWLAHRREEYPLAAENVLEKGFLDIDYRVYVTPDRDCEIAFQSRHFQAGALAVALIVVLALGVLGAALVPILTAATTP